MDPFIKRGICTVVLAAGMAASAVCTTTHAQGIYDSDGFEPTGTFVPGLLDGQDALDPAGPWTESSDSTLTIPPLVGSSVSQPAFGLQSVSLQSTGNEFGAIAVYPNLDNPGKVRISTNIYVEQNLSGGPNGPYGPVFGIAAYDSLDEIDFSLTSDIVAGSVALDSSDGALVAYNGGLDQTVFSTFTYARDTWHLLELLLDYNTQTYQVQIDGDLVEFQEFFPTPNSVGTTLDFVGNATELDFAGFEVFPDFSSGGVGGSTAYFDNFTIIPEPTTSMLLLAGCGLAFRRRRETC